LTLSDRSTRVAAASEPPSELWVDVEGAAAIADWEESELVSSEDMSLL